jgi:hypothetical protein
MVNRIECDEKARKLDKIRLKNLPSLEGRGLRGG